MKIYLKRLKKNIRYRRSCGFMGLLLLVVIFCGMGVGYAFLDSDVSIEGNTTVDDATWSVYFDNISVDSNSVSADTPDVQDTSVSFEARLLEPGDYYEFDIDVVNDGSIDAKIYSISLSPTLTSAQEEYFSYTVTYSDGEDLAVNHLLGAGDRETLTVRFEYLTNADHTLYPGEDQTFDILVEIEYVQADSNAFDRTSV